MITDLIIGISYDDNIGKAMKIINRLLLKDKRVLPDPAPAIIVKELAGSSVNLGVRPYVKATDYWGLVYDMNRLIKEEFEKQKITIPYPQTDLHMKKK